MPCPYEPHFQDEDIVFDAIYAIVGRTIFTTFVNFQTVTSLICLRFRQIVLRKFINEVRLREWGLDSPLPLQPTNSNIIALQRAALRSEPVAQRELAPIANALIERLTSAELLSFAVGDWNETPFGTIAQSQTAYHITVADNIVITNRYESYNLAFTMIYSRSSPEPSPGVNVLAGAAVDTGSFFIPDTIMHSDREQQHPSGVLRLRPQADGDNRQHHNLSVLYGDSIVPYKDNFLYIREFVSNGRVINARGHVITKEGLSGETSSVKYDEKENSSIKLHMPTLGWVLCEDSLVYFKRRVGPYIRTLSSKTVEGICTISKEGIVRSNKDLHNYSLLTSLFYRKDTEFKVGVSRNLPIFTVNEKLAFFKGKSDRLFCVYKTNVIGFYTPKGHIKVNKEYVNHIPLLQKEISCELR